VTLRPRGEAGVTRTDVAGRGHIGVVVPVDQSVRTDHPVCRNFGTSGINADHITALLTAAGALDRRARADRRHVARRAIVATLVFGGLRIDELCGLRWRDVDLATGRIRVGEAKTDAGLRLVDMLPVLRDELSTWKARAPRSKANDYVFATEAAGRPSKDNLRSRVIQAAIKLANETLEADGFVPLPDGLTPHGLRHTYASILIALGKNPRYVMEQIGHTDPGFTLRLYTHRMQSEASEEERLRALVDGVELGPAEMTQTNPAGNFARGGTG
jgi:integrase